MATLRIYGDVMDIQTKETLIAEIEQFKEEALKMHIVQVLADTYERSSLFDHNINADGSVIWFKTQARQLWDFWQAVKSQAVPEGFVLVPQNPTHKMMEASWAFLYAGSEDEWWDVYEEVMKAAQEPAND